MLRFPDTVISLLLLSFFSDVKRIYISIFLSFYLLIIEYNLTKKRGSITSVFLIYPSAL